MMTIPQIFVDMDGVLADFDSGYEAAFGVRPDKSADNVDWDAVRRREGFYAGLPPMSDMQELWDFLNRLDPAPIVLTGVPRSVREAPANKIAWVRKHLGDAEVRCCASKDKCLHAKPGDILIDDWEKYRSLWIAAGGRWITHMSASVTIDQLLEMGIGL